MVAIGSVFVVTVLYIVVERFAAAALAATGLPKDVARFQARSALAGVGFTTAEADLVVHHPVRRRIVQTLMLLGGAGLVTLIASLLLSFLDAGSTPVAGERITVLVVGLAVIWILARSRIVDRGLQTLIRWALRRWTDLNLRDYAQLLELHRDYAVSEIPIETSSWLASTPLADLELPQEGVLVLGVRRRDGTYLGAPAPTTVIRDGDTVVLYGRSDQLAELDERRRGDTGDQAHRRSVARQRQQIHEQITSDRQLATTQRGAADGRQRDQNIDRSHKGDSHA